MNRSVIGPLLLGVAGGMVLVSLGVWQVQRLTWKQGILAQIDGRIAMAPVALPAVPDVGVHKYMAVIAEGVFTGRELHVLASRKQAGAGFRIIAALKTGDRLVLVDRGFVPPVAKDAVRGAKPVTVIGNLHWPDEVDRFTPEPDQNRHIWYARDVAAMADALGSEPVLIVARTPTGDLVEPFPVDTRSIPNDHFGYAVAWFSLALVWFGMTVFLLWRIKRRSN